MTDLKPKIPITPSEQEADVLFRLQMKLAHLFLGYWKQGLIVLGVILLGSLFFGLGQGAVRDARRDASSEIASVVDKLPAADPLAAYGLAAPDDLTDQARVTALTQSAESFETIGQGRSGVSGARAWLRAGDTWLRLGNKDRALAAFEKAYAKKDIDILGYAAGNHIANIALEKGDKARAAQVLRDLATSQKGIYAEKALIDLMEIQISNSESDAAKKTAAEFKARFSKSPRLEQVALLEAKASVSGT